MNIFKSFMIVSCFSVLLSACGDVPENVSIRKSFPSEVKVGETFKILVSIDNDEDYRRILTSIDIDKEFLKGIYITKASPKPRQEYYAVGLHVFEYDKPIEAMQNQSIVLTAKALRVGDFSGDFDVCIDGDANCESGSIRVLVAHQESS